MELKLYKDKQEIAKELGINGCIDYDGLIVDFDFRNQRSNDVHCFYGTKGGYLHSPLLKSFPNSVTNTLKVLDFRNGKQGALVRVDDYWVLLNTDVPRYNIKSIEGYIDDASFSYSTLIQHPAYVNQQMLKLTVKSPRVFSQIDKDVYYDYSLYSSGAQVIFARKLLAEQGNSTDKKKQYKLTKQQQTTIDLINASLKLERS